MLGATLNRAVCTSASGKGKGQVQLHGLFKVGRILCIVKSCAAQTFVSLSYLLRKEDTNKKLKKQMFHDTKGILSLTGILVTNELNGFV